MRVSAASGLGRSRIAGSHGRHGLERRREIAADGPDRGGGGAGRRAARGVSAVHVDAELDWRAGRAGAARGQGPWAVAATAPPRRARRDGRRDEARRRRRGGRAALVRHPHGPARGVGRRAGRSSSCSTGWRTRSTSARRCGRSMPRGATAIVVRPRNWAMASGQAPGIIARASAGTSEFMPMAVAESPEDAAAFYAGRGLTVAAAADHDDAVPLHDADLTVAAVPARRRREAWRQTLHARPHGSDRPHSLRPAVPVLARHRRGPCRSSASRWLQQRAARTA